jgi:hypothetical protein
MKVELILFILLPFATAVHTEKDLWAKGSIGFVGLLALIFDAVAILEVYKLLDNN